jgi:hypothetical protein
MNGNVEKVQRQSLSRWARWPDDEHYLSVPGEHKDGQLLPGFHADIAGIAIRRAVPRGPWRPLLLTVSIQQHRTRGSISEATSL